MEAGRELDALVAEKVMGWRLVKRGRRVATGSDYQKPGMEVGGFRGNDDARRWISHVCPEYSTDIAAAWEVVEKMDHPDWRIEVGNSVDGGFYAIMEPHRPIDDCETCGEQSTKDWQAAPTAPHAICLAALAALKHPTP